jgi:pimeloyl-ACP methyl ester carboxylesterase
MIKKNIIQLPGYDGDGKGTFAKLTKLLSREYNSLVINYPYYRQTTKSYSQSELIDYVHEQIKNIRLQNSIFLDSRWGILASAYVTQYPKQINSLTLVSSSISPKLTDTYRALIISAYYVFKVPMLARLFASIYCSSLLAGLVKLLRYPSLGAISRQTRHIRSLVHYLVSYILINSDISTQINHSNLRKLAILFKDDLSFLQITTHLYFQI